MPLNRVVLFCLAVVLALPLWVPARAGETWYVACDDAFPPYNSVVGGKLSGIDVDLVDAIVRRAGAAPRFDAISWGRVRDRLDRNETDLAFQFIPRPERFANYYMVGPFRTGRTVFVVRRGSNVRYEKYEDLTRYVVGTVKGFSYGAPFDTDAGLRKDDAAGDNRQLIRMLVAGRFDIAIGDERTLAHFIRGENVAAQIETLPRAFNDVPRYIAVPRNRPEIAGRLERALSELRETGVLQAILDQWDKGVPSIQR